jgi:membrane fusion protein, heavy metal efflux system
MYNKLVILLLAVFIVSCNKHDHDHDHGHDHGDEHGHEHADVAHKFSLFGNHFELYAEVGNPIAGDETEFILHFNTLPSCEAVTDVPLLFNISGVESHRVSFAKVDRKGIYTLSVKFANPGLISLEFIIGTDEMKDTLRMDDVQIFSDPHEAEHALEEVDEGYIGFTKEDAWSLGVVTDVVAFTEFRNSKKAIGKFATKTEKETIITARVGGIVRLLGESNTSGKQISANQGLFMIAPSGLEDDNTDVRYYQAKSQFDKSKEEFDRAKKLLADKIVSDKEYARIKSEFEIAEAKFQSYSNYTPKSGTLVNSPTSGMIKELYVSNGNHVSTGQNLAKIINVDRMIIEVEILQKDYLKLQPITDALIEFGEFKVPLSELNGKLLSVSPSKTGNLNFITVYFEVNNKFNYMPGMPVEVYLYGGTSDKSLTVPHAAVWEDLGYFYVFVQKSGELFERREVQVGGYDGKSYLITSGLGEMERIVVNGTYRLVLASKSSEMPAHGHTH